jgi:signal transduction histidine kinase/ActR/RegA family two-component response regulator
MQSHLQPVLRGNTVDSSLREVLCHAASLYESGQCTAELWLERYLNHLTTQLHDGLSAEFDVEQLLERLTQELSHALEGEVLAVAFPQETDFGLTEAHLKSMSNTEWQSAWKLSDHQGELGWLVSVSAPAIGSESLFLQLRSQLVTCAIAQVMPILRQAQRIQKLQAENRDLQKVSQVKSEFLANTSHEIRTPLSSILGFTHLLREQGYNPSSLRHQEYLKIILSSGQHLLALINDILDLSKIEANQLSLQVETIEVKPLCKIALKLVKEKANDKGLSLKLSISPEVHTIVADPLRLKQMLFNLLSNALKFTEQGAVGLRVHQVEDQLLFTVWDSGTGISEEQQKLLFRPYTQLSNAAHGEGTGLGLALTQKLAELHGGCVSMTSVLNEGSEFTIALPLQAESTELSELETAALPTPPVRHTPKRRRPNRSYHILLVEDNAHNARLLITYLCKLGYEVTWAKDSQEMWQSLKQSLPALILMDIHLPGIDGLALTKELMAQKRYQCIPIIVQTAMAMKGDRERCLEAGACDYVSKPIDLAELAQMVAKYSQAKTKA